MKCADCRFHEPMPNPGNNSKGEPVPIGVCMRYPPQAMVNGSFQPPVVGSSTGWCGEFVVSPVKVVKNPTPTRNVKLKAPRP